MKTNTLKSMKLFTCGLVIFLALSTSTFAQINQSDGTRNKTWKDFPSPLDDYFRGLGSSGSGSSGSGFPESSPGKPIDPQKISPPKSVNNGDGSVTPVRF